MISTLSPRLEELGAVPPLHVDFVRLAALVFFADRTVPRPRGWLRQLDLDIAVSDPDRWSGRAETLAALLNALTGDVWQLRFSRRREPTAGTRAEAPDASRVVLFSGGADSASGALISDHDGSTPLLVSHHDWPAIRGQQNRVLDAFAASGVQRPEDISWRLARQSDQVGSGAQFGEEPSRRSRSIVFLALGLAVGSVHDAELWMAENGFTSLNAPLAGERRGALSTRTTHPAILDGFAEVLSSLGLHVDLVNPFETMTKGEVFSRVKAAIGDEAASAILSATNSCAKPQRLKGFAPDAQCGVCMGCLVRRGAFIASELEDRTTYMEVALQGQARRDQWLSPTRRETYEALRYRLVRGYDIDDVLDLGLPERIDLDNALALMTRGLSELERVAIP